MSAKALEYILSSTFSSNERLKVYYDFNTGSGGVFSVLSGSTYQSYIRNQFPAKDSGNYNGRIHLATGTTSGAAMSRATGNNTGFFRFGSSGNFENYNLVISGTPPVNLNDSSILISFSNTGTGIYQDGILFGSLQTQTQKVLGVDYINGSGFNIGVNNRGKIFFQSVSNDGPFVFCATSIELAPKNIIGVSVGQDEVKISRFDYLNNNIESESFPLQTSFIKNSDKLYLGSSPNYYKITGSLQKTWSGCIDEFALLSGKLESDFLFNLGKGFFSEYVYSGASVSSYTSITGYTPTKQYNTGVTGQSASITGYIQIPNSIKTSTGSFYATGVASIKEGERYYNYFAFNNSYGSGFYKEQAGYLNPQFSSSYSPTGESAMATLGLQTGNFSVPVYQEITGSTGVGHTQIPLYQINNLTGFTSEITGYSNTPLFGTGYITGAPSSGIIASGSAEEFKKNYIYFLDARI
jgi:hypothetical protein